MRYRAELIIAAAKGIMNDMYMMGDLSEEEWRHIHGIWKASRRSWRTATPTFTRTLGCIISSSKKRIDRFGIVWVKPHFPLRPKPLGWAPAQHSLQRKESQMTRPTSTPADCAHLAAHNATLLMFALVLAKRRGISLLAAVDIVKLAYPIDGHIN